MDATHKMLYIDLDTLRHYVDRCTIHVDVIHVGNDEAHVEYFLCIPRE